MIDSIAVSLFSNPNPNYSETSKLVYLMMKDDLKYGLLSCHKLQTPSHTPVLHKYKMMMMMTMRMMMRVRMMMMLTPPTHPSCTNSR